MELRQLEYLVAVAAEANFTKAAKRLHVAQPAVSAQIQKLERELGRRARRCVPSRVARSRPGLHPLTIVPELRGRLVLAWRSDGPTSPATRVLVQMARRLVGVGAGE